MSEFFAPPPPPPKPRAEIRPAPRPDWMGAPRTAVPAVVQAERVIARAGEVAVSLSRLWVYQGGLEFEVFVDADNERADFDPFDVRRFHRGSSAGDPSPERLLLGFEFADGTKATTVHEGPSWTGASDKESPVLMQRSGGSWDGHWYQKYWLWPLPPPGELDFVCEWPAAGIPLTRSELDATAIIEAASRAQTVFPDDREAHG